MTEIVLQTRNLKKTFRRDRTLFTAVNNVSFSLKKGESLGIVGESGSGKSTVAKMLTRLIDVSEGQIELMGKDITHAKGKELRKIYRDIQMVFQTPLESFDPRRTLGDGIGESLLNMGMSRREIRKKEEELMRICGLDASFADRYPHEVSGGQCQRAAIARALSVHPSVVICDEATSALDVTVQKQILMLMQSLKEKEGISFVVISHDLALVQNFCENVLVLHRGQTEEYGASDQIIQNSRSEYVRQLVDAAL